MKKICFRKGLAVLLLLGLLSGCASSETQEAGLADGKYTIEVESSSSMFRVVNAVLNVEEGQMTAAMTLGGTGYQCLYMGTGEEAETADESEYYGFTEGADGAYTYTVPVEALDTELDCAAFSIRKQKWYDRVLIFHSETLQPLMADGSYSIDVSMEGGSGKSTITSPTTLKVENGKMTALVEWSSPYYDYMIMDGEKYFPVNEEGNSVFEIPVCALDTELQVIGDTVAMSTPHEIEYTLTFHGESLK